MPVQIEPAPATSTAVVAQQPAADAPATPTPRDAAATAPAQPVESLAMVWELPLATRRELPAIAISMHVFAENPAQRFIILNGQRQVQGDDIGGLKLVEIRKDGAVFEFSGQRFLYPRGGR
ncbi:MAG: general secretion pathway protein GspB [Rhodanobacteraceae bacterium]|jgi:general secretion pathway protein B|nr:general secretion pathway protein GspB [Rhodanobacteraceae bacterium]